MVRNGIETGGAAAVGVDVVLLRVLLAVRGRPVVLQVRPGQDRELGVPLVRVLPFGELQVGRTVRVAPDFDEWPDDLAEAFGMRGGTAP